MMPTPRVHHRLLALLFSLFLANSCFKTKPPIPPVLFLHNVSASRLGGYTSHVGLGRVWLLGLFFCQVDFNGSP